MQNKIVPTKNLKKFYAGIEALAKGTKGTYGMLLVKGAPGLGKTEAARHQAMEDDYIYVRCTQVDTPRFLLESICLELGLVSKGVAKTLLKLICETLLARKQTIILDEVDYIIDRRFAEVVRDINDIANAPIVLVGMNEIDKRLKSLPHFFDRIISTVSFEPYSVVETKELAEQLCEVPLDDTAITYVHEQAQGKFRIMNQILETAENFGRIHKGKAVTGDDLRSAWKKPKTAIGR